MAEDNNVNNKKQQETEATKNAAVTAAKMHGGLIGAGVSLASKTKLGNAVLNKGAEAFNKQNPMAGKIANAVSKGNNDLINNKQNNNKSNPAGVDSNSSKTSGGLGSLLNEKSDNKSNSLVNGQFDGDFSSFIANFAKKHWTKLVAVAGGALLFLILFMAVYLIIGSIGGGVIEFFQNVGDAIIGFFSESQEEAAKKYYNKLEEVQSNRYNTKNVCIDVNLITATLTVDLDADSFIKHTEEEAPSDVNYISEDTEDPNYYKDENTVVEQYNKMTKEVELLANMQIKTIRYGLDTRLEDKCLPRDTEEPPEKETVSEEQSEFFNPKGLDWWNNLTVAGDFTSDNPELIAMHDKANFAAFFTKKINEETNHQFTFYRPRYELECAKSDSNGYCIKEEEVCHNDIPADEYELSIGDLKTMTESVYYWNLVNSFIPNYYSEYVPEAEGEERDKAIKHIAEKIYLLYKDLGPSMNCISAQEYICRSDEGSDYYTGNNSGQPVNTGGSTSAFFDNISSIAINEMSRTGVLASITMAQAALESSWGKSGLSTKYANYYGMTAGNCVSGSPAEHKGEILQPNQGNNSCSGNAYWDGTVVAMCNKSGKDCQWYRVYDSFENSTRDHSRLLTSSTYSGCTSYQNSQDQIQCIKDHKYATKATYVSDVMSVINKYNLKQYDIGVFDGGEIADSSEPLYRNALCLHMGSEGYGDWASWKQANSPWSSLKIGTKTIGQVGCLMTSVAIQIARSGVSTILGADFNPGTFMQAHKANGGFSGNMFNWDVTAVAPSFKYHGKVNANNSNVAGLISNYLSQGYYIILNLHHPGEHHVAVDRVEGNKIYMFDPGNYGNEVFSASWGGKLTIDSFSLYRVE